VKIQTFNKRVTNKQLNPNKFLRIETRQAVKTQVKLANSIRDNKTQLSATDTPFSTTSLLAPLVTRLCPLRNAI
jgi:hypothetical protein